MSNLTRTVLSWLASRVLLLSLVLVPSEQAAVGDLSIYHRWSIDAWCHGRIPGRDYAWEYPPGALPFAALPLGCSSPQVFISWYLGLALAVDLAILFTLRRLPDGSRACWVWTAFVPLVGPVTVARFDIVVCLLVALALLHLARRPAASGALLTVATAVKLWPALLLAVVAARRRRLPAVLGSAAVTTAVLVAGFAALGTLSALGSALRYQRDRGLQIESLAALPWVWAHVGGGARFRYAYGGWQVEGTGTSVGATVALVVAVMAVVLVLGYVVRTRPEGARLAALVAVGIAVVLVTDNVLSPQYLLWLGVAIAVLAGYEQLDRRLLAMTLGVAFLTQVIYPLGYHHLLIGSPWMAAVVTARDLGLLAVAVLLVRHLALHDPTKEDA